MHVFADHGLRIGEAQHTHARGIGKGAIAVEVDAVDGLGGRIQQQAYPLFADPDRLLGLLPFRDVLNVDCEALLGGLCDTGTP